ncbi:MAG: metal-dependent transcriptional regulator [Actinomycetota bacterium]
METSGSVQDYLKAIYSLGEGATTSAIANRLNVSSASVTAMFKRLATRGYLRHRKYQGVELTDSGNQLALEIIRHHRLIEMYLHKTLGIPWDEVHDEAEVLEHVLSERLEDRIADLLGHPTHDPHGDPIPPKNGAHKEVAHLTLGQFPAGPARVERVSDRDPEALRYMGELGLKPGTAITIEKQAPFGGPVWVKIRGQRHAVGRELADSIWVGPRNK